MAPKNRSPPSTASTSNSPHKPSLSHHHEFHNHSKLDRNFSFIGMLGLAFAILNSWTALAASLSLALPSGGPTSVLWGLVTAGVCNLALAASLAEFLSAFPTATATAGLLGSQLILGLISLWYANYVPQRWHQFLIYCGYTIFAFLMNTFATPALPVFNQAALCWSLVGFTVISVTVLAVKRHDYASAQFVFTDFLNTTGWPDGVAWLLGLLQGGLGLTGYDAVAHMVEEIPNPTVEGPKVMLACVGIGSGTGFIFLMVLLFVSGGRPALDSVITAPAGPLLQILYTSTNSKVGATCLLIFPLVCLLFAGTAILTTSSRMTWSFARSHGLPFSRIFAATHTNLRLPLNSLILTTILVILFGCIFLGSTAALNAIVAASVVALGISYAAPVFVSLLTLRRNLPATRPFRLRPEPLAWSVNILGVVYVALTSVLFVFPPTLPTTASAMNYCIAAFAIVVIVAAVQWVVDARKTFDGESLSLPGEPGVENVDGLGFDGRVVSGGRDGVGEIGADGGKTGGTIGIVDEEQASKAAKVNATGMLHMKEAGR